jgi:hypothetical protein
MRRMIVVWTAIMLLSAAGGAQEKPSASESLNSGNTVRSPNPEPTEGQRIKTLEDQVQLLTQQLSLLRGELTSLREASTAAPEFNPHVVLASAHPEPATISAAPIAKDTAAASPAEQDNPMQSSALQSYGGATSNAKLLNPDISMIGDFIGTVGHNRVVPSNSLELHESELGVQAIIDPYARGDFFVSFGEQGVNVEEGFVTFTSLPKGFVARVGKMRAAFGKVNTIHNHALDYIDRPLATVNLLGGEDGIDDAGISVTRIFAGPKDLFLEGTAQVFRGDSADVFQAHDRKDVSVVGHFRGYKDLSESTNLDIGFSYARGHNNTGSAFLTNLYGADTTLRWKPLRRAVYNSVLWRNEFFWSQRDQLSAAITPETVHAFGLYSSLNYRVNRRWTVGGRFDRSDRATNSALTDTGFSSIITYWPSEFSQIRGQYRFGRYAEGLTANEFLMQVLFVLGAHGAHPF